MGLSLLAEGDGEAAKARDGARVVLAQGVLADLEGAAVQLFRLRKLALSRIEHRGGTGDGGAGG